MGSKIKRSRAAQPSDNYCLFYRTQGGPEVSLTFFRTGHVQNRLDLHLRLPALSPHRLERHDVHVRTQRRLGTGRAAGSAIIIASPARTSSRRTSARGYDSARGPRTLRLAFHGVNGHLGLRECWNSRAKRRIREGASSARSTRPGTIGPTRWRGAVS